MHHAVQKELQAVHMHHAFQKELKTGIISVNMEQAILDHAFQNMEQAILDHAFQNMEQAIQEEVISTRDCLLITLMKGTKLGQTVLVAEGALLELERVVCFIFSNFYFASFFYLHI